MAEFRALGLGQAEHLGGPAPTLLLKALPSDQRGGRPGRPRARHRRRHAMRRAAMRPAALLGAVAAAVIALAVLVTGNFAGPFREIAHMASPSAGTRSSASSTGHSAAPRVEASSAARETTPPPSATYSTAPAQSVRSATCRAYYAYYKHPEGLSTWATELSLWDQLTKLAGTDNWVQVYRYCAAYVQDLFPAGNQGQAPQPSVHPGQGNQIGQQAGAPANSRPGSDSGAVSNGQANGSQGNSSGSGSNP